MIDSYVSLCGFAFFLLFGAALILRDAYRRVVTRGGLCHILLTWMIEWAIRLALKESDGKR